MKVIGLGRQWNSPYSCAEWSLLGASYPLVDDDSTEIWSRFGIGTVPQNVILDHTLSIRYATYGFNPEQISNLIEQLLSDIPEVVSVDPDPAVPDRILLSQNFPNPFNSRTDFRVELSMAGQYSLTVLDVTGRPVTELVNRFLDKGNHRFTWDATGNPSGIYFAILRGSGSVRSRKVLYVK